MKKIALAAVMAVLMSGAAKADWFDYVAVGGGYTQSPDLELKNIDRDMDYGFNLGAMMGWSQSTEISFAADVMFTQSEYDVGGQDTLQSTSLMLDAIYTCDTGDFWRPFIGAGAGGVYLRLDPDRLFLAPTSAREGSDIVFGYQGMAGISFDVDEKHAIFVAYRYQASSDAEIRNIGVEYTSHNFSIGVVFD